MGRERTRAIAVLCGLAVLVTGLAAVVSPARPQGSPGPGPVAEAPVFRVGDQWRWTSGGSRRVIAIEGELVVTPLSNQRCKDCRAYRDKNLTIVRLVDREGKSVEDPEVGYKTLDFPMTVGKQ